jgi:hypothetical protein
MGAVTSPTFVSLTPGYAVSSELTLLPGQRATYTITGTTEEGVTVYLDSSKTAGCWDGASVAFAASTAHSASGTLAPEVRTTYRWRVLVAATFKQDAAIACTINDLTDLVSEVKRADGTPVVQFTEEGMAVDVIAEKTSAVGVTIDGTKLQDGGVAMSAFGSLQCPAGAAISRTAIGFGTTSAEGLQFATIEETISCAGNAALSQDITSVIPAGAVIVSVQANVQAAVTGGGTTAKIGLGIATDPDKYGLSSALTKNVKIGGPADWAVLAASEQLGIYACAANGAAGNTALTVGSVRVRIVYAYCESLVNA